MRRCALALGLGCLLLAGCVNSQTRAQMDEENDRERDLDISTVGDVTYVDNLAPMKVEGVGLVVGLAGTGHSPAGYYRTLLEQYLLKSVGPRGGQIINDQDDVKIKRVLDDPRNAMVVVRGFIPAGVRRGDRFDVDVELPPGSKATSLAGGYLEMSMLRIYQAAGDLSDRHAGSNTLLAGPVFAQAKGPLFVGFGNNNDVNELKHGRIWSGGMSRLDRPYTFMMQLNKEEKTIKISNAIAERINFMYEDDPNRRPFVSEQQKHWKVFGAVHDQLNMRANAGGLQTEMAKPVNKNAINVRVPFAYRYNHARYLLVARQTPMMETDPNLPRYQQRLQKMLQDPRDTVRAAIRLEAMGRDKIPILKEGLENRHPLVRFACAESLAYLGSTAGVEMLTQLAHEHALFAPLATLAMANLGESICRDKLGSLLASPEPDVRTSAFHALSLIDEEDPRLGGLYLEETFWLYRIMHSATPMVYFSTSNRPQIVMFGRNITLAPNTRLIAGDFTVVVNGSKCVLKRITVEREEQRTCSDRVDEILVAMLDLHATYPDLVQFLRKAHDEHSVNCPVAAWAVPDVSLETLVEAGRDLK